jgi:RNA polymerase sigma-70 factor (ECF subfamily)
MELSVNERGQDDELAALANQARTGDAGAFDLLARRVRDRVHRWAKQVTKDQDDAEDVAQLVLLKLHARIEKFEGRSRFSTWLYRVTRNLAFNRRQRERSRNELLEHHSLELVDDEQSSPSARDDDVARLAEIVQFVAAELPQRQREVYELADLRGFNSEEIAERLGITSSTARGLLMKARRRVRKRILESRPHWAEEMLP